MTDSGSALYLSGRASAGVARNPLQDELAHGAEQGRLEDRTLRTYRPRTPARHARLERSRWLQRHGRRLLSEWRLRAGYQLWLVQGLAELAAGERAED
jgi:hypothetical protein